MRSIAGSLAGLTILVVEDEPLILLNIAQVLERTGVAITATTTLKHALLLVEHDGIDGAIVDLALGTDYSFVLCKRLEQRGVPFLVYTGMPSEVLEGSCTSTLILQKPAMDEELVAVLEHLIIGSRANISNRCCYSTSQFSIPN
jgi:DNA-binding response OmpR family regulator